MKMSTRTGFACIPPDEIRRRVNTIPLPKKVKTSFLISFRTWVESSGEEWTVSRLKAFKDCILQSWSAGRQMAYKPEWFRTTRSGRLAGVYGDLWSLAMESHSKLKAVLFLVNIYTTLTRTEATPEVLDSIESSVTSRRNITLPLRGHGSRIGRNDVRRALKKFGCLKNRSVSRPIPLTHQIPGKASHVKRLLKDLREISNFPMLSSKGNQLLSDSAGVDVSTGGSIYYPMDDVGTIHMTHEPGLKTRYFAAPNLVVQQALEPLKRDLLALLKSVPWDCTLDQRKADPVILRRLREGNMVFSVDLSSATDAFPWSFQDEVLSGLYPKAKAFKEVMRAAVRGKWELEDRELRFSTGQPLGLGPSFPIFTLSHGFLLYILNGYRWDGKFYVLGDDVVIFDESLHRKYREVLDRWDVSISESKSFASCRVAQFAGVTYTEEGSFWIPKWRPFTKDNIVDLAAWWYPGLLDGLPDAPLVERILALPEPFGIGRNPQGIPLAARLTDKVIGELVEREKRREQAVVPSVSRHSLLEAADVLRNFGVPENRIYDLVQRAKSWLNRHASLRLHKVHKATALSLRGEVALLAHGTHIPGYPTQKLRSVKVDPYTLGRLRSWKGLFSRVDSIEDQVVES